MSGSETSDANRIFLSYRRQEASAVAGRLYDRLIDRFGEEAIFMDVASIKPGAHYPRMINRAVASSRVMLVLIGEQWVNLTDEYGDKRLEDPYDLVRVEVETALLFDLPVIPVLIDNATMPRAQDLPESLQELSHYQAVELRLHRGQFQTDIKHLISAVEEILESTAAAKPAPPSGQEYITPPPPRPVMFVSYSHADEYWLTRLQVHLKPLARQGRIEIWDDTQIQVGDDWRSEIRKAVESCSVAILLVSADFMASDFIDRNELPPLLEAARGRGVRILPVLVSSSYFEDSDLARFQALNAPSKPLDMVVRGEQEAVFAKLHKAVRQSLLS